MTSRLLRTATFLVGVWTMVYTRRLPATTRDVRRSEIASDLWCAIHDPDAGSSGRVALQIIVRLVLGVPDDLGWRSEQVRAHGAVVGVRKVLAAGVLCSMTFAGAVALWQPHPPPLPVAPSFVSRAAGCQDLSSPPPPPKPPVAGPRNAEQPEWVYGETSYTIAGAGAPRTKVKDVRPVYPPMAIAADLQGVVVVEAKITQAGCLADARVTQPVGILTHSAIGAVKQWRFAPAVPPSPSVPQTIRVTVRFSRP